MEREHRWRHALEARRYDSSMADGDRDPTLVWEKMWVGRPEGTHFADNGRSPLAFSDEGTGLETQAVLERIDAEEDDDENVSEIDDSDQTSYLSDPALDKVWALVGVAVALGGVVLWAAPRIKTWVLGRRGKKMALPQTGEDAEGAEDERAIEAEVITAMEFTSLVEAVVEEPTTIMSSIEARQRMVECMLAAAVIADHIRAFRNVKIENDEGFSELETEQITQLERAVEQLSVLGVTNTINQLISADHTLLDEQQMKQLRDTFGGGYLANGEYVPLKKKKVRKALRTV